MIDQEPECEEDLFEWHLAYLRKNAQENPRRNLTPLGLVQADKDLLDRIAKDQNQSSSPNPARFHKLEMFRQNRLIAALVAILLNLTCLLLIRQGLLLPASATLLFSLFLLVYLCFSAPSKYSLRGLTGKQLLHNDKSDGSQIFDLDPNAVLCLQGLLKNTWLLEQKEKLIFDYSEHVLCELDRNLTVLRMNKYSEVILGLEPSQLFFKPFQETLTEPSKSLFIRSLQDQKEKQTPCLIEIQVRRNDGEIVDLLWRSEWSQKAVSFFCMGTDISERKRTERERNEMTTMISHDLRAPIAGLSFALQNMLSGSYGTLSSELEEVLNRSQNSTRAVLALLDNLLEAQNLSNAAARADIKPVDLKRLFKHTQEQFQDWCKAAGLHLVVEDTNLFLEGDVNLCSRILHNFCANAIKSTQAGGRITIRATQGGGAFGFIEVHDEGSGIPANMLESIFENRLNSGEVRNATLSAGAGLGLYIAGKLASLQGGSVGAANLEGGGAKLWLSLPKAKDN